MTKNVEYNKRPNQHLLDELESDGHLMKTRLNNVKFSDGFWEYIVTPKYYENLQAKGVLEEHDKQGVNDWFSVCGTDFQGREYSSIMFSPSLERLRRPDIMEYYGSGVVD